MFCFCDKNESRHKFNVSLTLYLSEVKRVRFSTSVLFSLSIGVELLTPAFPQYFLLLASIANIAKQISLACYLATGVSFSVSAFSLNVLEKDLVGIRNYLHFVSFVFCFLCILPN